MEAKELRIGNYIGCQDIKYFRVDEILWFNHLGYVARMRMSENFESTIDLQLDGREEPIHLTQELLLKCGFEKITKVGGNTFFSFKRKRGDLPKPVIEIYEDRTVVGNNTHVKHVEYVHQLQNLYFALTGDDLYINL